MRFFPEAGGRCTEDSSLTYSYYELGTTEPSLDNLCVLAKLFNISLNELLGIETESLSLGDPGIEDEFGTLRTGDLTRDEKTLIMYFRLMTASQRKELLNVMCNPGSSEEKDD